jgi:hypothetical protein
MTSCLVSAARRGGGPVKFKSDLCHVAVLAPHTVNVMLVLANAGERNAGLQGAKVNSEAIR